MTPGVEPGMPPARRTALTRLLVAAALLVAAGCGRRQAPQERRPMDAPTTVVVENRSWSPQTVHVVRAGQRLRLGEVGSSMTATFLLPETLVFGATRLRFVAAPVGASRYAISEDFIVEPGDQVRLIIPSR